jgi:hypothetical protein
MDAKMDKLKLLDLIRAEHDFLARTIAPLSDAQMVQPGAQDDWSVKDILAHIVVWEQRCLGWIEAAERGETPERPEPGFTWDDLDALNERDYLADKDRPLSQVMADFRRSFAQFLAKVNNLSDAQLFDPHFYDWPPGEPLWIAVAANAHWHYLEHTESIRTWLNQKGT